MDRPTFAILLFAIFAVLVGVVSCSEAIKPRPAATCFVPTPGGHA